jgi:hypothetical protein
MITNIEYHEAQKLTKTHECAVCGGRLAVAWGGSYGINKHVLRCGNDTKHDTIRKINPIPKYLREAVMEARELTIKRIDKPAMLERVNKAKFPQDLTVAERNLLADICIQYKLDPLMSEVTVYQGRPYVTYDGRMRKAQETKLLDGIETRPATADEKKAFECADGDYLWVANVHVKEKSFPFVGWGYVRARETQPPVKADGSQGRAGYRPSEVNPNRMAEKRAEMFALRKAFHLPLPTFIDGTPAGDEEPEYVTVIEAEDTGVEFLSREMATAEQLKTIEQAVKKDGYNAAKFIDAQGWTVKTSRELTQDQASLLISDYRDKKPEVIICKT